MRGILAAIAEECRYCLICDERRPDLVARWFEVLAAIRHSDQRCRCVLVTWQEISRTLPKGLQKWLEEKYGIGFNIGMAFAAETDSDLRTQYALCSCNLERLIFNRSAALETATKRFEISLRVRLAKVQIELLVAPGSLLIHRQRIGA